MKNSLCLSESKRPMYGRRFLLLPGGHFVSGSAPENRKRSRREHAHKARSFSVFREDKARSASVRPTVRIAEQSERVQIRKEDKARNPENVIDEQILKV